MNKLTLVKTAISKTAGRSGLVLKKFSPEILMGFGVVGIVGATVMACRATLKANAIVDEYHEKIEKIKLAKQCTDDAKYPKEEYSDQDYRKDLIVLKTQTAVDFVKLYGPSVALGAVSIACILGSHNILRKRNVALAAAYKLLEGGFKDYRRRVVEELGLDKDREFKTGIKKDGLVTTEVEVDENGKKTKVKKTSDVFDPNKYSTYARFFDETCKSWSTTPEYNLMFLKCQQNYANDLLRSRGHVFLNEVYEMLGIPHSKEGAVVGWVISKDGDNFVDFGIYDLDKARARDFVNGYEKSILLDFNVDGVIYDLI